MKQFMILGLILATSIQSLASDYSSNIGAQAIARTAVEKKLVDKDARKVILMALETGKAGLGKMECERALGADHCVIDVYIHDDETTLDAEESWFQLNVKIRAGKVVSAVWDLVAG